MSGPFIAERVAQPLDLLEQGVAGGGWEGLNELFAPIKEGELQPSDQVAMLLYGLYLSQGRELIEWLMDITIRMPLRSTGQTFEHTALMTATRQGINGVGEAILKAIAKGKELAEKPKPAPPNGDTP
ncbi:hypothetical protein [Rhizobium sp. ICMP 5592]|uniref:hypothetical protein n=1 Tax=Rhizobium sp. ICMP 5592 TaxID=2292445 RepID=UPI00129791A2|nr:hypothetical protein [Rhizobium sp. ICMP 5592]MQB43382.1 hypothetical protein [Rhizobium sp. ICMP 5592]